MKTLKTVYSSLPAIRWFKFSAGGAARRCAVLLLAASGTVLAQQAPADNTAAAAGAIEEVVVTGIRHGVESAIKVKRDSGSIVEAISAEDIGKLPDTSIAESISRLPGLTSQRAEGRASAISLRGTDPGFTTTLMNGREQVSTGDNRSIEYDQYPSELINQVLVYKTPDAQLVGQGLAGTVDLNTVRPLAYGKRAVVFNLRGEKNSQGDLGADSTDKGYRISASYIGQFMDNRLGFAIGVARLDSPLATEGAGTYEPWHANGTPSAGGNNPTGVVNPGVGPDVYVTDGIKVRTDMGKNRRDGVMGVLQWKPNDFYSGTLDMYYTKRDQTDNARSLEINLGGYPGPCCDGTFPDNTVFGYSNPTIRDNTVVAGTLNTRVPLARNFLFLTRDQIFATGLNNKFDFGNWTVTGDLSYSRAVRDEKQYETNATYPSDRRASCTTLTPAPDCHTVVLKPGTTTGELIDTPRQVYDTGVFSLSNDHMPTLSFNGNYANPALVQLGPTIYGAGYSKIPHITDELKSARVDLVHPANGAIGSWFDNLAFGLNYADRSKVKYQPEGGLSTIGGGYVQIDSKYLLSPTNLSYAGAGSALAWDVPGVLAAYYQPIVYGTPATASYLIGKNWSVKEKVATAYLRGTLNHALSSGATLKGNIGLQIVRTDQSSDALISVKPPTGPNVVTPFTNGKKFTDVLPAINFAFMLSGQQAVRIGLARELARPRMDQLKASSEQGISPFGVPSGSGGNPKLDPWRADAFDLSYEKYFAGSKGYVSAAVFYKKLKSYIYNQTDQNHNFADFVATLPPCFGGTPPNCPPVPQTVGSFTGPVNGSGGSLKGLELSVSLPGEVLTDSLRGFGAILSLSETESGIAIQDPPGNDFITGNGLGTITLPGLSKTVWNATLFYERSGFSARIATRARSKYIGEVTNFANDRSFKFVKGDQITDFQTGYEFSAGSLKGLSALLQVNNLTNEPYIAYSRIETRQQDYQTYGRQFLLGLNYKL